MCSRKDPDLMVLWRVLLLFLSLSLPLFTACEFHDPKQAAPEDPDEARIFGGTRLSTDDEMGQFVVALRGFISGEEIRCTGTLVSPRVVLTAAHCLPDDKRFLKSVRIRLATGEVGNASVIVRPEQYDEILRRHPNSPELLFYDFGLLILEKELKPRSSNIRLARRFSPRGRNFDFWVAGAGAAEAVLEVLSRGERRVISSGIGVFRKVKLYAASSSFASEQMMSLERDRGVCVGDSGAPALIREKGEWVQIGLAIFTRFSGREPCHSAHFLNLTFVSRESPFSRADWIRQQIQSLTGLKTSP